LHDKKQTFQGGAIWGSGKKGKPALTHWMCLDRGKHASLLQCELVTGRTHQLRVHCAEMHHPILGDILYAKCFFAPFRPKRQMLHAYRLSFPHPLTGEKIEVIASIPDDFFQALSLLHMPHAVELLHKEKQQNRSEE
jgi:23S rRNA-/tRNA-specific pseudouridylate synthase